MSLNMDCQLIKLSYTPPPQPLLKNIWLVSSQIYCLSLFNLLLLTCNHWILSLKRLLILRFQAVVCPPKLATLIVSKKFVYFWFKMLITYKRSNGWNVDVNVAERAVPSTEVLAVSAARLGAGPAAMWVGAETREAQERTCQSVSVVCFSFTLIATCKEDLIVIAYDFFRPCVI